jgi:hypothetical protein
MGKRELLLIAGFLIVGAVLYRFTAPPPRPGEAGFSISRIWREIHSGIRSDPARGEATISTSAPACAGLRLVRAREIRGEISVQGEDRADLTAELRVSVAGANEQEARTLARRFAVALRPSSDADGLDLVVSVPDGLRRFQTSISLRIPRRLAVELEATTGPVAVRDVAELRLSVLRSDTTISHIKGEVRGEQRDGSLQISDAGSLRLVTRRTDLELERIAGDSSLDISDGDLELRRIEGPLRIDGRRAELDLLETGPLQLVTTDGEVRIASPRAPLKIETLRADVSLRLAEPVEVQIICDDAPIEVVLPPSGGTTVDALVTDGEIHVQAADLQVTREPSGQRVQGNIEGGGPTLRLRTSQADITIRK